ncbi:10884_t:CDS:2 [Racocetra fulgida]|uniref:10884_t:CDS:1 n=1 Tax=Racocetra fulgida TaxID=60492 RepID=A0A9N8VF74_9GLOM|nr:10884_t:CDS:2 [Racocetra fulgida]
MSPVKMDNASVFALLIKDNAAVIAPVKTDNASVFALLIKHNAAVIA